MLDTLFLVLELLFGVLLITAVLLQAQGSGLGAAFGGDDAIYHERRGAEKRLHQITIVSAILFCGIALVQSLV